MRRVTIQYAKRSLSALIKTVISGEELFITRNRVPVARLIPIRATTRARRPGLLKGKLSVGPKFFEPLPSDELAP